MGGGHLTRRPVGWLLAAALFVILSITSVLGAGFAAAPAVAIAAGPASIGAALFHPTPSVGRDDEKAAGGEASAREHSFEERHQPRDGQLPAATRPAALWVAPLESSEPVLIGRSEPALSSRAVPGNPSRAPPA
ncbi:hypothetical protein GCM10027280_03320 [Micromonospora polyrhachis]|uniref:Uncharacterized protein n=1 Tax=Micromonospora polyrhachis TaxID=1282883 RepID=A0A7W7SMB0_9ACTN|nr:hypothetical protein [Micromonospora polyrhachis]MBB4957369.1 hypothetical protein [Micromonospora polyrhachis]